MIDSFVIDPNKIHNQNQSWSRRNWKQLIWMGRIQQVKEITQSIIVYFTD